MSQKMTYTDEELIGRICDKESVIQVMNRHAYMYSNEMRREELAQLWVTDEALLETASLGYNNGYYIGMKEVARHYVADRHEEMRQSLSAYQAARPDAGLTGFDLGLGMTAMHTATTPLVYISDDGRTARYLCMDIGQQTTGRPDGSADAFHVIGRVFADLVKEGEAWKIWHLVLQHDHTIAAGTDYTEVPVLQAEEDDPIYAHFGTPTVPTEVYHPLYGWEDMYEDMPRPYYTYRAADGYTAGGKLGKPYYKRVRLEE